MDQGKVGFPEREILGSSDATDLVQLISGVFATEGYAQYEVRDEHPPHHEGTEFLQHCPGFVYRKRGVK